MSNKAKRWVRPWMFWAVLWLPALIIAIARAPKEASQIVRNELFGWNFEHD